MLSNGSPPGLFTLQYTRVVVLRWNAQQLRQKKIQIAYHKELYIYQKINSITPWTECYALSLPCELYTYQPLVVSTPETQFSEPRFSEKLDLMNKLQAPFFIFYSLSRLHLVNLLNLANKKGLTTTFTKLSFGYMS